MNKAEMIVKITEKTDLTKKQADEALSALWVS